MDEEHLRALAAAAGDDGEPSWTAHLAELYPGGRLHGAALLAAIERFNNPAQPVVGVCWYEARAYCAWLAAQTGVAFRLPTEVEWEAAARGQAARRYAYGDAFDPLAGNTVETQCSGRARWGCSWRATRRRG